MNDIQLTTKKTPLSTARLAVQSFALSLALAAGPCSRPAGLAGQRGGNKRVGAYNTTGATINAAFIAGLYSPRGLALDALGHLLVTSTSDPSASLPSNYALTAGDQGVHIFSSVKLKKTGAQTITVTDAFTSSVFVALR
jgi:hypothetical protein